MKRRQLLAVPASCVPRVTLLLLLNATTCSTASASEGDQFQRLVRVAGRELALLGKGVSTRFAWDIYAVALYVSVGVEDLDQVFRGTEPSRVQMTLIRSISRDDLRGVIAEMARTPYHQTGLSSTRWRLRGLLETFADAVGDLARGDQVTFDWMPGIGLSVSHNTRTVAGPINDSVLYALILGTWLGPEASDGQLRSSLLGRFGNRRFPSAYLHNTKH